MVYLYGIVPFMSDIVKSIHAEQVSNYALSTFQWTLSGIIELRTAVGALLEGLYGEMASKIASICKQMPICKQMLLSLVL